MGTVTASSLGDSADSAYGREWTFTVVRALKCVVVHRGFLSAAARPAPSHRVLKEDPRGCSRVCDGS